MASVMSDETKQLRRIKQFLIDLWQPIERVDVVKWCEENIYLSSRITSEPGWYSTLSTPYVKEPLRMLDDHKIRTVVLCFGSQTGKTQTILNWLCYRVANDPAPALFVMPNENMARSLSETRLQTMIEDCQALDKFIPDKKNKMKNLEMHFTNMTLVLVGSNSPANVASRPVEIVVADEVDKFADATSKEASALALALERTKRFPNRKHVITSTPTTDRGAIWQEYNLGDKRKYFVPCPHCNESQEFIFENIKWDANCKDGDKWNFKKVQNSAYYECQHCKGKITDSQKPKMLRAGEWRPTDEAKENGRVSYHLNSIYSSTLSFGDVAVKFLQEKHFLNGLMNFFNSWLSLPFTDQHERPADFVPNTERSKLEKWESEAVRLMGVDVQLECFYYVCRAWDTAGNSVLIDEGKVRLFEDLEAKREELKVNPEYLFIDSGYNTQAVYANAWRYGWTCTKGEDRQELYRHPNGARHIYAPIQHMRAYSVDGNAFVPLLLFSSQHTQDVLSWLIQGNGLSSWESASDVSNEYKKHMVSHVKKMTFNKQTGTEKYLWCKIGTHTPDHLWDCETILTTAACYGKLIQVQAVEEEPKEEEK